ncbi:probable transcription factor At5g61620 [Zingiber officinale]|uniref:probable transcription factor At5g61620 n=1 Tax=Zingiber officinale TaxID=94328 RepID=UPI001C4B5537|nr:probable transcription factor At5g61620 [Zingiber officinale]
MEALRGSRSEAFAMEAQEGVQGRGVKVLKLFGVSIIGGEAREGGEGMGEAEEDEEMEEEVMRKSWSTGNLVSCTSAASAADHGLDQGYHSDGGLLPSPSGSRKKSHERKRGIPWTEEEHRTFLIGLKKLGKGDWRGISRKFVTTRTPTQVASHAQKYFLRQSNTGKKKRRCSLFDVVVNDKVSTTETAPLSSSKENNEVQENNSHYNQDNNSVRLSNNWTTGMSSVAGGTSSDFQNVTSQSNATNLPTTPMVVITSHPHILGMPPTNVPIQTNMPSHTIVYPSPHFVELSLSSYPSSQIRPSSTVPTEATDLELRMAPPQPRTRAKVPAHGAAGAIRVI